MRPGPAAGWERAGVMAVDPGRPGAVERRLGDEGADRPAVAMDDRGTLTTLDPLLPPP